MPIKVTRMFHAAVNTAGKQQECHEFYTNFLGLPEVPVDLPGLNVAPADLPIFWLEKENVQLHVISSPRTGNEIDPVGNHVSWYVEDIDAAVTVIEDKGLPMKAMGEGRQRIVWIQDPAGNTMELQQDPDC